MSQYLFQRGLATLALFIILSFQDAVLRAAIVNAIASSAFIVFVTPSIRRRPAPTWGW